jgi:hypothetical protein
MTCIPAGPRAIPGCARARVALAPVWRHALWLARGRPACPREGMACG